MSENKRRHERKSLSEPASLKSGDNELEATLKDVSDGGVSVVFDIPLGVSRVHFDIGDNVEISSGSLDNRQGRVIRHYDKGFAVKFQ